MPDVKYSRKRTQYLVRVSILAALLFFLEISGIGYIRIPLLSMTIMQVPVIIGAIVLGPAAGGFLGAVFGLTSLWQAVSAKDPIGNALLGLNPVGLFITTVPTRILMGIFCGLIYRLLKRVLKDSNLQLLIASLSGALLNTLFFMSMFILFFFNTPVIQNIAADIGTGNPIKFAFILVGVQGLIEAVICAILGTAIAKALGKSKLMNT